MRVAIAVVALAWLAAADETRASRSFTMTYETSTKDVPAGAKQVRLWIPVPMDSAEQKITNVSFTITAGGQSAMAPLASVGSLQAVGGVSLKCTVAKIEHGWGQSLCVETPGQPVALKMTFDCTRHEARAGGTATEAELEEALGENATIPLGKKVSEVADGIEDGESEMDTGKVLYDHTLDRMKYDKPDDGGKWGRGDSEWACDAKYGNCTDFHSYFMALARTKGIPARFEMGFSVPGGAEKEAKIGGYHCWAFFHVEGKGWVPVDISEADKNPDKAQYFFGNLCENRVTMTGGRDLLLTPRPAAGTLNFFVYPVVEVDGKPGAADKAFSRTNK